MKKNELKEKKEELKRLLVEYNNYQKTLQELSQRILKTQGIVEFLEEQEKKD